jgi:dTDP-4-dehydrorhamnose 3,5-epimerase
MRFERAGLDGVWIVETEPVCDERGWFLRTYDREAFDAHGIGFDVVHANTSFNARRGTLRGMHWQADPHGERKLVRCVRGAVHDVVVDVRDGSPTRGQWLAVGLAERDGRMLYVPEGIAHGFQTLEDASELAYLMSHEYVPQAARGLRFDDPALGIEWPAGPRIVSERDRSHPDFAA